MAKVAILSYIKRKSPVHELTGTTKLIFYHMERCVHGDL